MSDIWLLVTLLATFFGVLLAVYAVDLVVNDRRSSAVRLLQAHVAGGTDSSAANIRDAELAEPFANRALLPIFSGAARLARRLTPLDSRDRLAKRLVLAGSPRGWDAERVLALKVIGGVGGIVGGATIIVLGLLDGLAGIVLLGLLGFAGWAGPDALLSGKVADRQKEIRNALSDTLDLLTISVEAGLSLNAALARVVQSTPGVLSQEFARMLQEIQLGVSRSEAFRNLAERTDVEELNAFTLAMIQADVFGVSISNVLRTQAQQLRLKRRQRAEREAQGTPVKIVFPLILCILPALFVVIVGPGAIRIYESLLKGA
jgi:tight adherence protein C